MAENTPNNPNHSLDRRREEKALENLAQDTTTRFVDLTTSGLEVVQKNIAWQSEIARYWADNLTIAHNSMNHIVASMQQRRAG